MIIYVFSQICMYTSISPYWDRFARKFLLLIRSESALHSLHSEQRLQTCSFSLVSTLSAHVPRLQLVQHIFDEYPAHTCVFCTWPAGCNWSFWNVLKKPGMLCFKAFHQVSNILGISIGLNSLCPISVLGSKTSRKISTAIGIGSLGKLKTFEIAAKNTFFSHLLQDLTHCCEIVSRIYIPLPEEAARQRMLEHFLKDRIRKAVGKAVSDVWTVSTGSYVHWFQVAAISIHFMFRETLIPKWTKKTSIS